MPRIFRSGRADSWTSPRAPMDASIRSMSHGKILPMEEPSFLEKLFGRH